MPKLLTAGMILAKNRLDPQSAWLELYQLVVTGSSTLYLTNHPTPVVYESKEYQPYPIRHQEVREEAHGRLQKITVHVANVLREVQDYLEQHDGLRGKTVRLILVNADDLTLGDLRPDYIIDAVTVNDLVATFILGKPIPILGLRFPTVLINHDNAPGLPIVS